MRTTLRHLVLPFAGVATLVAGVAGVSVVRANLSANAVSASPTSVVPVTPYRILDTRNSIGVASGQPVGPGQTIDVQIAGVGPVPVDAVGVVLNVTGTQTTEATYVTAWPTGTPQPTASVLNLTPGIDAPNGVTALLGDGGRLSLFNFTGSTHLIADVAGYLVTAGDGGTPGPQGPQGAQGPAGPQGPSGPGALAIDVTRNESGFPGVIRVYRGVSIQTVCSGSEARIRLVATGGATVRARGTLFAGMVSTVLIAESTTMIDFTNATSARVTVASSGNEPFIIDVTSENEGTTCTFLGSVTPIDGDL